MKRIYLIVILSCFFSEINYSQRITIDHIESRLVTHEGVEFIGTLEENSKSNFYLFKNWSNKGIIFVDNKTYYLENINFNITNNSFDSRIGRKKLFSFKTSEIDAVTIKGHTFKKIRNTFYEVLFEKNGKKLYKKYNIKYREGIVNRIGGEVGPVRKSIKFDYLLSINDSLKKIELNKKSILKALNSYKNLVNDYLKNNRTSFKNEKGIISLLAYMSKSSV